MAVLVIKDLIEQLKADTLEAVHRVEEDFLKLPEEDLLWKPAENEWSIIQCVQHLNIVNKIYLDIVSKAIAKARPAKKATFKTGWLGNKLVKSMQPGKKGKITKMKAPGFLQPVANTSETRPVLQAFLQQQKQWLDLLEKAEKVNLEKTKAALSFTRTFKLRLGDSLRFVTYHSMRHIMQAERVNNSRKLS